MTWLFAILFIGGMALIISEVLVPGGVLGTIGVVLIVVSTVIGARTFPEYALWIVTGELFGAFVAFVMGLYLLANTRLGHVFVSDLSQDASQGWVSNKSNEDLLGKEGTVYSALRPSGTVLVEGKRVDAVSDGDFIDKGDAVKVLEIHGNRVVVEKTGNVAN